MKKLLIVAVVFCSAFVSCQSSKSIKSFTTLDSLSYAFGINASEYLGVRALEDSTLVGDIFATAIRDVFTGKTQMTSEEAGNFLNEYYSIRKPALLKAEGIAWLEEVKASNPNIQTTATGLMYEIINAGDSAVKATPADQVLAKYRGTLKDGTEFDAGETTFSLGGVIPGWTEGLQLIGKGGEIVLWIPTEIAYDAQPPYGSPIPPYAALKFEITLIDVIPAAPAE